MIAHGYEVEWIGEYKPDAVDVVAGEFDPDACVYFTRDFTSILKAQAFAKRIRHKAVCFKIAWMTEFREQPDPYAPGLVERIYVGEQKEFS